MCRARFQKTTRIDIRRVVVQDEVSGACWANISCFVVQGEDLEAICVNNRGFVVQGGVSEIVEGVR